LLFFVHVLAALTTGEKILYKWTGSCESYKREQAAVGEKN